MTFYKKILVVLFSLLTFAAQAQYNDVAMADTMRSNGKIYVVVAVLTIVLAGILFYVINTDKKISRLEEEIENK
jgi:prolipoprotein diacylglyceryltransferase